MKTLKISINEIEELIKKTYKIKNIMFMMSRSYESDFEICEYPDYVEGLVEDK